jgi:hypothetical protein
VTISWNPLGQKNSKYPKFIWSRGNAHINQKRNRGCFSKVLELEFRGAIKKFKLDSPNLDRSGFVRGFV